MATPSMPVPEAQASISPFGRVTGVLRGLGAKPWLENTMTFAGGAPEAVRVVDRTVLSTLAHESDVAFPAPYLLVVEAEDPLAPGLFPAPVAEPND